MHETARIALVVIVCRQVVPNNPAEVKGLIRPCSSSDLNIKFQIRLVSPTAHGSHGWEGGRANDIASEEDTHGLAFAGDIEVGKHGDDVPPIRYRRVWLLPPP